MKTQLTREQLEETEGRPRPEEWLDRKLGDLLEKTEQKDMRRIDAKFKYIDVSSIDRDLLRIDSFTYFKGKEAPSRARKVIKSQDVIIATVRPTLKRIAVVSEEYDNQICSTAFCVLRAKKDLNSDYLYYFVQNDCFIDELGKIQKGANYPAVSDSEIKNRHIVLPPLPEQQRIAFVLSKIRETRVKSKNVVNSLKELKKSLVKQLLTYGIGSLEDVEKVKLKETEIGEIPAKWDTVKLSSVFRLTSGKERPKDTLPAKAGANTIPVYGGNGIMGYTKQKLLDKSAIILGRVGEYCGAAYLSKEACWVSDNALYSKEILLPINLDYLCIALRKLDLNRQKNTGGQPLISQSIVYSQSIPLPSSQEQEEIARTILAVDEAIAAEEDNRKALDELFKSTLSKLMSAKIRATNLEA